MRGVLAVLLIFLILPSIGASDEVSRELLEIDRAKRAYYLLIPQSLDATPAPLLVVLHGSGRDGRSLVDPVRDLASREHLIVVGPDAVDPRRMYLFGHSAGAAFALTMSLLESEFFAATAVHAGYLERADRDQFLTVPRKIPIAMFHGRNDPIVPVAAARDARDVLASRGFPVHLTEIPGHDHNFYIRADAIVGQVWHFLKAQALVADPRFQVYSHQRR